ncbi:hypothetical protein ACFLSS_02035 [Bacteroidota bacterium]
MIRFNQIQFALVFALVMIFSFVLIAKEPAKASKNVVSSYNDYTVFTGDKLSLIEDNLLKGVKSNNTGLQTSSAYFLGEMKSDRALIPLLNLVRNGKTEESRIIAALSLYKIESKIGMYRLKGLSKRDESHLVRKVFDRLYKIYAVNGYSFN